MASASWPGLDRKLLMLNTSGGAPQEVPVIPENELPIRWLDNDSVLVASRKDDVTMLSRVSLSTGAQALVRSVLYTNQTNQAGLRSILWVPRDAGPEVVRLLLRPSTAAQSWT